MSNGTNARPPQTPPGGRGLEFPAPFQRRFQGVFHKLLQDVVLLQYRKRGLSHAALYPLSPTGGEGRVRGTRLGVRGSRRA